MFSRAGFFVLTLIALFAVGHLKSQIPNEGVFCHPPTGECIKIEPLDKGFLVKRPAQNSWRLFSRSFENVYFDRKANRIEVLSPSELVFVKNNSARGLHYILQGSEVLQAEKTGWHGPDADVPDSGRVEGLWFSDEYQEYLIVVETREGIKVRFRDSRIWFTYEVENSTGYFINEQGNKYIFREKQLRYFHHDGLNSINFRKISDNFDGY